MRVIGLVFPKSSPLWSIPRERTLVQTTIWRSTSPHGTRASPHTSGMAIRPERAGLLVLTAVVAVASTPATVFANSRSPTNWAKLHRPLHLPQPAPGAACPVSGGVIPRWPGRPLNGRGPAFLMGVGNAPLGVIDISQSTPRAGGWRGQKTPWAVRWRYQGPVLIRARRIDEAGSVRFAPGHGPDQSELRWPARRTVAPKGPYRWWASTTYFRAPGCYAFQADGTSFSTVVVMKVTG
jgi:hypothetical protein